MTNDDLTETDKHFLRSLHYNGREMDIGTGAFPRGMSDRRARELELAGYVKGQDHHFGSGWLSWPGIRYMIADKGFEAIKDMPGVKPYVDTRWADYVASQQAKDNER